MADYFDYSVTRKGSVYLLTKRHSNPDDLPDVTPEECKIGLRAISRILAPFNPGFSQGTFAGEPMASIAHLLNAEERDRLHQRGIPVSELTSVQHQEVWRLAMKFFLQAEADRVEESYAAVENRNPPDPVFHWQTIMNVNAFGYDTRSVQLNKILFIPVSNSNQIMVFANGMSGHLTSANKQKGVTSPSIDPTDPTGVSEPMKRFMDDNGRSSHAVSISQAVAALNARPANQVVYKVDVAYAAKLVTLAGIDKLSADIVMRSLAAVYGLRLVNKEDGSFVLTHPAPTEVKRLSDLAGSIRSAIPTPIYRTIQARLTSRHAERTMRLFPVLAGQYEEQASELRPTAIQLFRYGVEPKVKSQTGAKLALSHLNERERSMFALADTIGEFSEACWLADRPLPPYIADFDHVILTGGMYRSAEGAERFSLYFSYPNPKTGRMYRGVGFSNAIVP